MVDNMKNITKNEFQTAFDNICCVCADRIMEGEVKHKITDKDDFTWTMCDACWQRIKHIMDQEG